MQVLACSSLQTSQNGYEWLNSVTKSLEVEL